MKTNQIMIRDDEAFIQRTKDKYFSATNLINNWNIKNPQNRKDVSKYKKNKSTVEYIQQLEKEGIEKPIKSSNKGTWMHPKVFIDFAMWISVEFKSKVIDYVLDGLIESRHNAGDYYNQMCAAILDTYVDIYNKKPPALIFKNEANLVKSLVTEKDRNEMTEQELKQITYLQKVNANLIRKAIGKTSRINKLKEAAEIKI